MSNSPHLLFTPYFYPLDRRDSATIVAETLGDTTPQKKVEKIRPSIFLSKLQIIVPIMVYSLVFLGETRESGRNAHRRSKGDIGQSIRV
jgi:hypothetical protein